MIPSGVLAIKYERLGTKTGLHRDVASAMRELETVTALTIRG